MQSCQMNLEAKRQEQSKRSTDQRPTCTVSASKTVILRSLPPKASNFPLGETSKLVTGFLATVLVLINFQVSISQTEIKAFLSPPLPLRLFVVVDLGGVAFTTVKRREAV